VGGGGEAKNPNKTTVKKGGTHPANHLKKGVGNEIEFKYFAENIVLSLNRNPSGFYFYVKAALLTKYCHHYILLVTGEIMLEK
jgi:hypothetical protein